MKKKIILPPTTLERLPLYYRTLKELQEGGISLISSKQLGEILDITSVQIRKDLAFLGNVGMKGFGYDVEKLKKSIAEILGLNYRRRLGIVGAGYFGTALASCKNFSDMGFEVAALFDVDERIIGSRVNGIKVYDIEKISSVILRKRIEIGVIAVPKDFAQETADILVAAGIKGILNFAPTKIITPQKIFLRNEDLSFALSTLSHKITESEQQGIF